MSDSEYQKRAGIGELEAFVIERLILGDQKASDDSDDYTIACVQLIQQARLQEEAVHLYALIVEQSYIRELPMNIGSVNEAIIQRWSRTGLESIKHRAWKVARVPKAAL